jgi:hypothetical protein
MVVVVDTKEVGREVNLHQTKNVWLYRHQNSGINHNIANRSSENVTNYRYLGTTVTYTNMIHEEIKRRLNSGNASYHSV